MVNHAVTNPDHPALIRHAIESHRPSELFVRAAKSADRIHSVRVGATP